MKFFSANLDSLRDLYRNQLRMLLSTEDQIIDALPTMIEKATDVQLKQAFQSHLQETRVHKTRLQEILNEELQKAEPIKCKVLAALVTEAEDLIKDATDPSVRDVALIAAAQRVEHYEIASYGAVRRWAQILGEGETALFHSDALPAKHACEGRLVVTDRRMRTIAPPIRIASQSAKCHAS